MHSCLIADDELPGRKGLSKRIEKYFKERLKVLDLDFLMIFTIAFREYAINSFKVSDFDYLLKPISRDELAATLNLRDSFDHNVPLKSELNQMINNQGNRYKNENKIPIPIQKGFRMLDEKDIVFL